MPSQRFPHTQEQSLAIINDILESDKNVVSTYVFSVWVVLFSFIFNNA